MSLKRQRVFRIVKRARIVLLITTVALASFLVLIAYSAAKVRVIPPSRVEKTIAGNVAIIRAPFSIANEGWFSVSGLSIRVAVTNSSGYFFAENETRIENVPPGSSVEASIVFCINVTELFERGGAYNVFYPDIFRVRVRASGIYAGVVFFELSGIYKYAWSPPVRSLSVELLGTSPFYENDRVGIRLSFRVTYDGDVSIKNIKLWSDARNASRGVAYWEGMIDSLDPGVSEFSAYCCLEEGLVEYYLTHDDSFVLRLCAEAYGVQSCKESSYSWGAPFYRINITDVTVQGKTAVITLEGDNHNDELEISYRAEVYEGGELIGSVENSTLIPEGTYVKKISVELEREPTGSVTVLLYVLDPIRFGPLKYEQG